MNISALYNDYNDKLNNEYDRTNSLIAASLLHIIGQYFSNLSNYFVLTKCCRNIYSCSFYSDIVALIFANWREWPLQIVTVNEDRYEEVEGDRQYNIIFTDSYEAFLQTKIHTYTEGYNKNEYYFIFLHTLDNLVFDEMQKIFEYCWQNYLINCVIEILDANGRLLLFTYFPFTEKYCGQVNTVLVNEYNGISLINEDLFPKKLKNFFGCPLRAALFHIPPYVRLSTNKNNISYVSGGFEGKLLLELSKKLNFSVDVVVSVNETYSKFETTTNDSMSNALTMVLNHQADLTLGSTRQTQLRMLLLTSSMYYYQTNWKIITLSEAYNLTSLETLMFPFADTTWYLMASMGIFVLSFVALLKTKLPKYLLKNPDHIILDVLLIAFGMPAIVKPIYNSTRILKATWIICSLILRTIYQALLFHLIRTHVTRNVPQNLREIVDQNYSLILDENIFEGLENISTFKTMNYIVMNTSDYMTPLKYLETIPVNQARYTAAVVPLGGYQYYIEKYKKINSFKVLPQNLLNVKLSIFFSKHSYLVKQFDDVLMMFKGFGIYDAWLIQEFGASFTQKTKIRENQIFGMKELKTAFALFLLGNMIAMAVFAMELIYKKIKLNRIANKTKLNEKI